MNQGSGKEQAVQWLPAYSVKIEAFDDQHRILFDSINDILEALKKSSSRDVMSEVIDRLVRFTEEHFGKEERFLEKHSYPSLEEHRKEHQAFVDRIKQYRDLYNSGEMDISLSILEFLVKWLTGHILGTDHKYTDYFLKNGIIPAESEH